MSNLPNKTSKYKNANKKRRRAQPFWNDHLKTLWNDRCDKEKIYCNFKCKKPNDLSYKNSLRHDFLVAQKMFDKSFRYYQRQHKIEKFKGFGDIGNMNPNEVWKRINQLTERKQTKVILEIIREDKTISNDLKEVLQKWHLDFSKSFSGLKDNPENAFDDDFLAHIEKLKQQFEEMSPEDQRVGSPIDDSTINVDLTQQEVSQAIDRSKLGKAFLDVPNEALKNDQAKKLLYRFYSICFEYGLSPLDWDFCNIKPIEKNGKDPRIPLNNRPLSILCCISKIYSSILNSRLQKHLEENELLADEQNGFRAARSCLDHLFSLITILRNRKAQGKSTFLCFVDYKLAFDSVNRSLLFFKLSNKFGITGRMYKAISSLYRDPRARIILNDIPTDYFQCLIGTKQGDCHSPTLFSMFVNDLSE